MRRLITKTLIATLPVFLCACSPVKVDPIKTYTISNLQKKTYAGHTRSRKTLLVTSPIPAAGYQTAQMIYIKTPYELQHFSTHKWIAPPSQMILPILTQALRNTHYFHAVAESPFSGNSDYRLDTKLLALQQEFLSPKSRVRVAVLASLLNNNTNKILASRVFTVTVPAPQNNPYNGVLATSNAVNRLSREIANFVVQRTR